MAVMKATYYIRPLFRGTNKMKDSGFRMQKNKKTAYGSQSLQKNCGRLSKKNSQGSSH